MHSRNKAIIYFLFLLSCCASAADDTVILKYAVTGFSSWFPFDTMIVYQSGKAEVITAATNSNATKTSSLTPAELNTLARLFADNNYSSLDSNFLTPCLICPEFHIWYDNKQIVGNSTDGNAQLANIKAGLDTLVAKIKNGAPVVPFKDNRAAAFGEVSPSIGARLSLNHGGSRLRIVMVQPGGAGYFTLSGQRAAFVR